MQTAVSVRPLLNEGEEGLRRVYGHPEAYW